MTDDLKSIEEPRPDSNKPVPPRNIRAAVKRLLPEVVIKEVRNYRAYAKNERPIYLKTRISNGLRLNDRKVPSSRLPIRSIIFVCFGNIIRSPMCEGLTKRALANFPNLRIAVTSAGLNATQGRPAHPWAIAAAQEFRISLEEHCARLLTREMVSEADAIFAMDYQNQVQLLTRWPESKGKVYMLSAYAGSDYRAVEIPDPYYLGEAQTRRCYQVLDVCIQNLVNTLSDQPQPGDSARG